MLHPTGLGENLFKLVLADTDNFRFFIKEDGTRTRGSLIERQDITHF